MSKIDLSTIILLATIYIIGCYLARRISKQLFYDNRKTFINLTINALCVLSSWILVLFMIILYYIYGNKSR